jgi:hypothetical protein
MYVSAAAIPTRKKCRKCHLIFLSRVFGQRQGDQMSLWEKIAQNVDQHFFLSEIKA